MNDTIKKMFSVIQGKAPVPRVLYLLVCVLLLVPGHSPVVSAQEKDVRVIVGPGKAGAVEIKTDNEDVIIDEDIIYIDDLDNEEKTIKIDRTREGGEAPGGEMKPSQEGGRSRSRSGDRFPPEVQKMMEEEGVSPADLMRDPALREKFRTKVEEARKSGEGPETGEGTEPTKGSGGRQRRSGQQRRDGASGGLELYTNAIVRKNLFLQLGSGDEKRGPEYALTAVVASNTPGESDNKAIIEQRGGGASYYVSEGDTFAGGIEVVDIEDKSVKLDRSGEEVTLALGEGAGAGGGGRRGGGRGGRNAGGEGGGRSGGGGSKEEQLSGGGDFNPDQIPPFARRMLEEQGISIEQLQNDPGLRDRLRRQFEERFRDGGGGPQTFQMQGGRGRGRRN